MIASALGLLLLLGRGSPSWAASEPDVSRFSSADLPRMADDVRRLQRADPARIQEYIRAYAARCGSISDGSCLIEERDIPSLKNPRDGRVLLFRGESGLFPLPATSLLLRQTLVDDTLCGPHCDYPALAASLRDKLLALIGFDFCVYGNTQIFYDQRSRSWLAISDPPGSTSPHRGEMRPVEELPKGSSCDETIGNAFVMSLLVDGHVYEQGLHTISRDGRQSRLDAAVSFSASPEVALRFAKGGRLIALSVPRDRLLREEKDCWNQIPAHDQFLQVVRCDAWSSTSKLFLNEAEYDAMFYAPDAFLFDVLLVGDR